VLEGNNASTTSSNFDCPINQTDKEIELELSPELLKLVEQETKEIKPHKEPTEVINLGTSDKKKEVKIGTLMKKE